MVSNMDMKHLKRCVELAEEALDAGDAPFGSVLVSADGDVLKEDRNRDATVDKTHHPEFELARWAAQNMTPEDRKQATVYTSGEHCSMCSTAHGIAGLDRIVYVSSSRQLSEWHKDMNISKEGPIYSYPIEDIIRDANVEGPVPELAEQVRELQRRYHEG
ncbi:nucleoside deaminase [Barrientosiimonas marina]|uniref:Nucleoside deaminase n=1 Tax=Lentibacillus kimchii TaxID=1542911 RepID=A0ABW2UWX5_9BACI